MADNSILNNSYVVGIGGRNLVLNTFGRVYVKVQDKYYELDFKNGFGKDKSSESNIIVVNTKLDLSSLPYPGDGNIILSKDGFIFYTEENEVKEFTINLDSVELINPSVIGTVTIDSGNNSPFVVNSKTLVKNLNVEFLNGYTSNDFAKLNDNETISGQWIFDQNVYFGGKIYGEGAEFDLRTGKLVVKSLIVKDGSNVVGESYFDVDGNNNLYAKEGRGIYSEGFISCRGLDPLSFGTFGYATEAFVSQSIAELVGAAPETLDTLEEIANAISGNQGVLDILTQSITNNTNAITTLNRYFTNGASNYAIQLKNSRYIWGQEFNGTSDVSGHMHNVGNINFSNGQILTPTVSGHLHLNEGFVSDSFISCRGLDASARQGEGLSEVTIYLGSTPYKSDANGVITLPAYPEGGGVSGDYLPLIGGTMQGDIVIPMGNYVRVGNAYEAYAMLGHDSSGILVGTPNLPLLLRSNGTSTINGNTLLHSGNYSDYALPKSGGTISSTKFQPLIVDSTWEGNSKDVRIALSHKGEIKGLLNWNSSDGLRLYENTYGKYIGLTPDGTPTYSGNTLIHSGNIGDYAFVPRTQIVNNTNADNLLTNGVYLNATGNGSGSSNFPNTYGVFLTFTQSSKYAAQISIARDGMYVRRKIDTWSDWKTIAFTDSDITGNATTADSLAKSWTEDINYAIGTSSLKLISNGGATAGNFASGYTSGLSVMTEYVGWQLISYGGSEENPWFRSLIDNGNWKQWRKIAFLDDNVASATKLQTARTIWGQSFDGTGNVSGDLDMRYSKITFAESANDYHIGWGSGNMFVYQNYYGHYFNTNGTERMRITFNGNVLIGSTDDNGVNKLQVNGSIRASFGQFGPILINKGYGDKVGDHTIETNTAGAMLYINYYHNGGLNLCQGGGNVGIGTTDPKSKLDVNGNIYASGYQLPTFAPINPVSGGYYLYVGTLGAGAVIS